MYRLIIESLLGLRLRIDDEGAWLDITPCLPADWDRYEVDYCFRRTMYHLEVVAVEGEGDAAVLEIDGAVVEGSALPLADDGRPHPVRVGIACRSPVA